MELLNLEYNVVFKELFTDRELLNGFISTIIGNKLQVMSLDCKEDNTPEDGRSIMFDMLAVDKYKRTSNIKMEKSLIDNIKKIKYSDSNDTIFINILVNNVFNDEVVCRELLPFTYVIELQKSQYIKEKNLKALWLKILSGSHNIKNLDRDRYIINKAIDKIYQISESEKLQFEVVKEALEESKRLDWKDDVLEMIEEEVNMLTKTLYDPEVEKKAIEKRDIEIIKNMLEEGLDENMINKFTKIDLEKIKKIKDSYIN